MDTVSVVVRRVATEFRGQCGVIVGYAADTTLAHLAVEDLPYSGVCVGWGWRRFRELARDYLQTGPIWSESVPSLELDELELNHLRALGYAIP